MLMVWYTAEYSMDNSKTTQTEGIGAAVAGLILLQKSLHERRIAEDKINKLESSS